MIGSPGKARHRSDDTGPRRSQEAFPRHDMRIIGERLAGCQPRPRNGRRRRRQEKREEADRQLAQLHDLAVLGVDRGRPFLSFPIVG
jgi:hypothetical protein